MIRVDGPAPQNLSLSPETRSTPMNTGAWKGERMEVMDTSKSVLADAAEEITMSLAEKSESKRLDERKAEPQHARDLKKIEEVTLYLEQMHGESGKSKLEETAQRILSGRREGTSPREEARRSFEDPTEQFMALTYAARKGEQEGADPARLESVHDALAELEEDFGPQIRAGMAAAAGARELGTDPAGSQQFRDTYRDIVLGKADLAGTFDELLQRHGLEDFPRIVPALIKSLGEDLSSVRPSRDPERMQAILQDLYNLEVAVTVLEQSRALSETVAKARV
jgi:type III secretion protein W